jgi:lysine-specific metallo-endopeptidase family protein
MQYALSGFPKDDSALMKEAYRLAAAGSRKALKALLAGNLDQYRIYFEAKQTKHLMKVTSVVKDIDDTINNKKVRFVYAGPRVHRSQAHVCGNRVPPPKELDEGTLAAVEGHSTAFASKDFGHKVVKTNDGKIKVEQAWELKWLPSEGLTVYVVPKNHSGGLKQLAETLYHELSHAVANTDDLTYDPVACRQLATKGGASVNAENYCLFASTYMV